MGTTEIVVGGEFVSLKFKVQDNVESDTNIPVILKNIKVYDSSKNKFDIKTADGDIYVLNYDFDDVDGEKR